MNGMNGIKAKYQCNTNIWKIIQNGLIMNDIVNSPIDYLGVITTPFLVR